MRTNLIQSYIYDSNASKRYNSDNAKKNFDVNKELNNRTFIKPLQSNGHLVSNSIFDAPAEFLRDVKYNAKALKHSIQGTAKDKELGNLNDMGMKLGGLAIASYLFTMKQTPLVKLMEFVGFGTFFAAMNIWPKLALQLPAYLIHGFNIRQEYRDNYGTKKPVFLDHQFIPWDLYSDEQINKIGNRLGVPKDMKNRRDYIQEKMRKIALQNNTMWMLTSGFATPIMSALLCDAMQKPIANYLAKKNNAKADDLLEHFHDYAMKYDFSAKNAGLSSLLEENKGKPLSSELISKIAKTVSAGTDTITANAIDRDFQNILKPNGFDISRNTFEQIGEKLMRIILKSENAQELKDFVPSADEIIEKLEQDEKEIFKSGKTKSNVIDFSEYVKALYNATEEKIDNFANAHSDKNMKKVRFTFDRIINSASENGDFNIVKIFKSTASGLLSDDVINKVKSVNEVINNFIARQNVLDKYAYMKSAQAPETSLANSWNDFLSDDMLKTLGITEKEIKQTRMDSKLVHDLIRSKFEDIVADESKYNQVIKTINDKLCKLEYETKFSVFDRNNANSENPYKVSVDSTFDKASGDLKSLGMKFTPQRLNGYEAQDCHTLKDLQFSFVQDRVRGVKSSFYRILNTLDMFKRISSVDYEEGLFKNIPRQVKEELVEMCKELLLGGHAADYSVKFYYPRNSELNPSLPDKDARDAHFASLEKENGKIVYKFVGQKPVDELVDMPYDTEFYKKAMSLMYTQNLHDDTYNRIKDSTFYENFIKYRNEMYAVHGGDRYFAKPSHIADWGEKTSTTEYRFQLLGTSLDDMFTKLFSSKYNSKKWMNMFGGLGLALLGITVLSQFFMGRMPDEKKSAGGNK